MNEDIILLQLGLQKQKLVAQVRLEGLRTLPDGSCNIIKNRNQITLAHLHELGRAIGLSLIHQMSQIASCQTPSTFLSTEHLGHS